MTLRHSENPIDDLREFDVLGTVSVLKGQFSETNEMNVNDMQNIWRNYQRYLHGEPDTQDMLEAYTQKVTEQFENDQPAETLTLRQRKEQTVVNFQEAILSYWHQKMTDMSQAETTEIR